MRAGPDSDAPSRRPVAGPADSRPAVDAPSRGLILLVDDEPAIARAYARTLGVAGFSVVTATDGREAAAAARDKNFDVIVSDIAMPEMNGLELLRAVREHDLDVPFVIMTGGPAVDSAVRAMEYGALRYLIKPVEPAELEEVVARAVRLHQMAKIKREALEMFRLEGKHLGDRASLEARLGARAGDVVDRVPADRVVVAPDGVRVRGAGAQRGADAAVAARPVRGGRAAGAAAGPGAHRPRSRRAHAGRAADGGAAVHQPARDGAGRRFADLGRRRRCRATRRASCWR